jgi:5'-methylthioadenosine phosphorylase
MIKIGIIGGSGLDNPDILEDAKEIEFQTPYGKPSSTLKTGKIKGVDVVLLARHGRAHTIPPTQVNYRANIYSLKKAGCTHILATTAVGSLKEEVQRGDLVVLDQFIDFTRHRSISFHETFDPGNPVHTPMAEPFCSKIRGILNESLEEMDVAHHKTGTVITIEGPRFSTKAESRMFKAWGADVINMSVAPEAALAKEANVPYAAVAMSTDYDCWKDDEESVTWDDILRVFKSNSVKVTDLLINAIPKIKQSETSPELEKCMEMKCEIKKESENLKSTYKYEHLIATVPDFPKPGIQFKDITTLIKDPIALKAVIEDMAAPYKNQKIDLVIGAESRGFIFGTGIALELGAGFIPARKPGKLPGKVHKKEYELEYGKDALEIREGAIKQGMNVLVVDDLIATGGTIKAVASMVEDMGANIAGLAFLLDLANLHGDIGYPYTTLITCEVDE